MKPLTVSFNAKSRDDSLPYINFDSYAHKTEANNHDPIHKLPEKLKTNPAQLSLALAHEIRNPLTNIQLSVGMLSLAITDENQKMYLDVIMRNSVRINKLLIDLLRFQRTDNGQTGKHSIHKLLDEVLEIAEDRIKLKKIVVKKDYAAKVHKLVLNRPKIKIGLANIIINAIDSMPAEKGELKVATKSTHDKFVVQIEDNGCGISRTNLKKIFKPYFTNKPGGLGLGLATTYEILQSNQVEVKVESEEGQGTRFNLLFDNNHQ